MNTAALLTHQTGSFAADYASRDSDANWFGPARKPILDAEDFCAVAFAFAFAAGLVLGGALAWDAYLLMIIGRGALDDFAAYQLACDLLPWSGAFTFVAAGLAGLGLKLACAVRRRTIAL